MRTSDGFTALNCLGLLFPLACGLYMKGFIFCFFTVKIRIKSFRVPELFIEIAETATVGSLKV